MGKVTKEIQVDKIEREGLDKSIFRKKGNSKTYSGYLIQKLKEARKQNNFDVASLIEHFYKKYREFEEERIFLKGWKGKSGIKVITHPDKYIIITHQKPDQDSKPREFRREISKEEVNRVILAIEHFNMLEKINTRQIGEFVYKGYTWDEIFADRFKHTQLNLILRLLDYKKMIKYRGRFTTIINKLEMEK